MIDVILNFLERLMKNFQLFRVGFIADVQISVVVMRKIPEPPQELVDAIDAVCIPWLGNFRGPRNISYIRSVSAP